MRLTFHMPNQELVERFIKSPYFEQWSNGGVPMREALDKFIRARPDPEGYGGGLGCVEYEKEEFDYLQLTAIKMCQKRQRLMQYETEGRP